MEPIKAEGELAADMVPLLGEELKAARKRIQAFEGEDGKGEVPSASEPIQAGTEIGCKCVEKL